MIKKIIPLWFTLGLIIVVFSYNNSFSPSIMGFIEGFSNIELKASFLTVIENSVYFIEKIGLLDLQIEIGSFPAVNDISDILKVFKHLINVIYDFMKMIVNCAVVSFDLGFSMLRFLFDFLQDFVNILKFIASYLLAI